MTLSSDALSGALAALDVSASVLLHYRYRPPWSLEIPTSEELDQLTGAGLDERTVAFHWAEDGGFRLATEEATIDVAAGELVVCFGGLPHRMSSGDGGPRVTLADLMSGQATLVEDDGPDTTQLICGVFRLRDAHLNPLMATLPRVIHARTEEPSFRPLAQLLRAELGGGEGSDFIVGRALGILCAAVVRQHLECDSTVPGFLGALRDPRLGRAISAVHESPATSWTLDALAQRAGMSRSRFAARFAELAGDSPMSYVARWRMTVATRLLRRSEQSVAEVAEAVGYESIPAFSRAFKKHVGQPPGQLRRS